MKNIKPVTCAVDMAEAAASAAPRDRVREALAATITTIVRTFEKRDPYSVGHQCRVAQLSTRIGEALGLGAEQLEGLRLGATLHDIGKIYVPSDILGRPGQLGAGELAIMQAHPEIGYDLLKEIDFPWPVARMVVEHHERLDGSGYPFGLQGEAILPESRIIAVADVVEAMTSHRPHRPAVELEEALNTLCRQAGKQLDAEVVDTCCAILERNPGLARSWSLPIAA